MSEDLSASAAVHRCIRRARDLAGSGSVLARELERTLGRKVALSTVSGWASGHAMAPADVLIAAVRLFPADLSVDEFALEAGEITLAAQVRDLREQLTVLRLAVDELRRDQGRPGLQMPEPA